MPLRENVFQQLASGQSDPPANRFCIRGKEMANPVEPVLIQPLYEALQKERFAVIATVDHETGAPCTNAISWLFAKDEKTVYFAISNRSRAVSNLKKKNLLTITVIANESVYAISGRGEIKSERIEGIPLKLAMVEVKIDEVRDIMFYGSVISTEPAYRKSYDETAAARLDNQVMEALRKA